ncbi:Ger(x)C family spore germination protein [Niallia sp. Krafla_26]|uniref:Ger(x)C family spore germination protein n=1 Tax=Niallia sp. Krafla_26 TaxID=3064703 RepID=UPI003D16DDFB
MNRVVHRVKTMLIVFLILGSTLLQSGCGFKDIDKRLFVMAIGIDASEKQEDMYKVTLKIALPSGSLKEASGDMYTYLTQESTKVTDAIRMLKTHVDKEFDFGHLKTIVIGEKLLSHDISNIIDSFLRRRDFQRISWLAAGRPTAEKVLKTEPKSEMAASVALFNIFSDTGVDTPYAIDTYIFDIRRRMLENGIDPVIPVIETDEENTRFMVNKSIILKDHVAELQLSHRKTKLLNILRNELDKLELFIEKDGSEYMISVDDANTKFKVLTGNKIPVIKVNIDMAGIVEESDRSIEPKRLDILSKHTSDEVGEWIKELLVEFQENKLDPVGFGLRYRATRLNHKDLFKEWEDELYPNAKFDVNVNIGIKSTGVIE